MARTKRFEGWAKREQAFREKRLKLGNYLIVTDATVTEAVYIQGLKDSLPSEIRDNIHIEIIKGIKTRELISKACKTRNRLPTACDTWIMFDKDEVANFDDIIDNAEGNDLSVAWSNPCLEIWFMAYFNLFPNISVSGDCVRAFKSTCRAKINSNYEYKKNNKDLYQKLATYGDEELALRGARKKHNRYKDDHVLPSKMDGCTTVYRLVEAIQKNCVN